MTPTSDSLAPLGRRSVAYAIDDMLISLLFVVILWDRLATLASPEAFAALMNTLWLYMVMVKILYHTLFVWQYGASLGKMAMKIAVVDAASGQRPSLAAAFNRAIFRIVSEMLFYLGFLWAFWDARRQTWHDKTANTRVVHA